MKKFLPSLGILVIASALCLPGCASQYGEQKTKVNYYPQCYEPVKQLRDDENAVAKSTASGAATGALAGAIIGFASTGKASGAAAGAAAGGATGAVAGNVYGKQKAAENDAAKIAQYAKQLDEDTAGMNRATAAAKVALKCYNGEFKRAVADYKAGKISKDELANRYKEIRSGLQEVSYILTQKYDDMSKKDAEYEQALAKDFTEQKATSGKKKGKKKLTTVQQSSKNYHEAKQDLEKTKADVDKESEEELEIMSVMLDKNQLPQEATEKAAA